MTSDTTTTLEVPDSLSDAAPTVKVCYLVLRAHDNPLSQQTLVSKTQCPRRSVRRALSKLIDDGHVNEVQGLRRHPQRTHYALRDSD
jgi:transcription initiation factor IIE alpha subunit